jgi:hypothetical protein
MTYRTKNLTEQYLRDFTVREGLLLELIKEKKLELPVRLKNWRLWVGDSQIYLNELRNLLETSGHSAVVDAEQKHKALATLKEVFPTAMKNITQ